MRTFIHTHIYTHPMYTHLAGMMMVEDTDQIDRTTCPTARVLCLVLREVGRVAHYDRRASNLVY